MTPTQLRSFSTVVRVGSVRGAARELGVTDAAVSSNIGALRRELEDQLFHRSAKGLVFTPGGMRLAGRAFEILGLQAQTRREVSEAHNGRRLLRIAATSLFAEYAAPGLIELFSARAGDLEVELLVKPLDQFAELLATHGADLAIGPKASQPQSHAVEETSFLRYDLIAVAGADLVEQDPASQTWVLGPSAVEPGGVSQFILQRVGVPESQQRVYPSHAAALEEARNGRVVALVPSFALDKVLASESLSRLSDTRCSAQGTWTTFAPPPDRMSPAAEELVRFVNTPRAIQAMLGGSGTRIGHFKPSVHITLWS